MNALLRFCLENRLVVFLVAAALIVGGVIVAPFDWSFPGLHRDPVPVDAIPDIGEKQQIVFADWMGRSPRDVEDQVTYPLTVALLGVPGVRTVRSYSMFGFSEIFVIFEDQADFNDSRTRVLERLSSLAPGTLPPGVQPRLGPDATPLGQVFWYTLEGRDAQGQPTGGWDLEELRTIQDWQVKLALQSADGVSEVASIGGYVREYQVDADPEAMRAYGVTLMELADAVRRSNLDVGAGVMEINRVEYMVRSVGFIRSPADIEESVIKAMNGTPVYVRQVARVSLGPQFRQGALDKEGAETVGGVVVVRYGANPLEVIGGVRKKISEISAGLPRKTLANGTVSQVRIVPFYDRTQLIHETLGTLSTAMYEQVLITTIVVLLMARHFASSLLISGVMPLAVLASFIGMRLLRVDANLVSLSGIAIAIGTVVDMGIIICENILKHLHGGDGTVTGLPPALSWRESLERIHRASVEVGSAVLTSISTTIVGFLPVFWMEGAEGKLFKPLAYTKTLALAASVIIALTLIPPLAHVLFVRKPGRERLRTAYHAGLVAVGLGAAVLTPWWGAGAIIAAIGAQNLVRPHLPERGKRRLEPLTRWLAVAGILVLLTSHWMPVGVGQGLPRNLITVAAWIGALMSVYFILQHFYRPILGWCLEHKGLFLSVPLFLVAFGLLVWIGFDPMFRWVPRTIRTSRLVSSIAHRFPGLGREFMPPLDEGAYLYMPSAMPHASIGAVLEILQTQDRLIRGVPEVASVVGKLGRAESALDPAPVSMIETIIHYRPRFLEADGVREAFRFDAAGEDFARDPEGREVAAPDGRPYKVRGRFARDSGGRLIPDPRGRPFPLWRPALDPELNPGRAAWPGIWKPDDIWDAIVAAAEVTGSTSAPRLQPIATRIVMLQSGMRAPMGLKISGPDLATIEKTGLEMERLLKQVPMIEPATVVADRVIGKPYLEIVPDREALARYGIRIQDFQDAVELALGGMTVTSTVEGRQRFPVRIRYLRELRDSPEAVGRVLVSAMDGTQVPLSQLARIDYRRGPDMIKSEDTFPVSYVLFDRRPGYAEVDVVEQAVAFLRHKLEAGELALPAGVSYAFAGSYENQVRAQQKLALVVPLSLFVIFLLLHFQFRHYAISFFVFAGILVAWAGGFLLIWLYGQPWFLRGSLFGADLRELFQVHPINLSVAVWVGFLALFGVASDDGVVMCTYLEQRFKGAAFTSVAEIRSATIEAGLRRIRPCLMTTATTVLALMPVLTSSGRGADLMAPMAIPSFGGMAIEILTMFTAPVLYCAWRERQWR